MDIRFLESLICVVDSGSIAETARIQSITAAAVSQRIQSLEQQLDCSLLNRAGHKVKPTESCMNLLSRARRIVSDTHSLSADIDSSGLSGVFRIGAISTALTSMIPDALKQLGKYAPNAKWNISPGTSSALYKEMQNERLDAAIIVKPPFPIPKDLTFKKLRTEKLVLISSEPITGSIFDELKERPYIRYDPTSRGGRIAEKFVTNSNIVKASICDLDGLETISLLVSQNLGVSLVPDWSGFDCVSKKDKPELFYKFVDDDNYDRELVLLYPRYPNRPKIIDKFISLVS